MLVPAAVTLVPGLGGWRLAGSCCAGTRGMSSSLQMSEWMSVWVWSDYQAQPQLYRGIVTNYPVILTISYHIKETLDVINWVAGCGCPISMSLCLICIMYLMGLKCLTVCHHSEEMIMIYYYT